MKPRKTHPIKKPPEKPPSSPYEEPETIGFRVAGGPVRKGEGIHAAMERSDQRGGEPVERVVLQKSGKKPGADEVVGKPVYRDFTPKGHLTDELLFIGISGNLLVELMSAPPAEVGTGGEGERVPHRLVVYRVKSDGTHEVLRNILYQEHLALNDGKSLQGHFMASNPGEQIGVKVVDVDGRTIEGHSHAQEPMSISFGS